MSTTTRRTFLSSLGGGLVAAGVASRLTSHAAFALALEGRDELSFGALEPLAARIQETAPDALQRALIEELAGELALEPLVGACALANARTFGGHDYTGYHCMMALAPAYEMARLLPDAARPLPVLKVVHRTARRIQESGGRASEKLRAPLPEPPALSHRSARRLLREAFVEREVDAAEAAFAALAAGGPGGALEGLLAILLENLDVHRVVLAWRAIETLQLTGDEHAATLLRQSVRFCIDAEQNRIDRGRPEPQMRALLPALLTEHALAAGAPGTREVTDDDVAELGRVVFGANPADAAAAVAKALGDGWRTADVGEALSLAANALLLNDPGRDRDEGSEKPRGTVHGASVGLHASDAARAWRNLAGVASPGSAAACLIAGAHHTAGQSNRVGASPFGYRERLDDVPEGGADELLAAARAAVEASDQALACAAAERYIERGGAVRPFLDLMLAFATSEDGALHAEKYFRTACEEHAAARPAFRARQLVALARVTASEHGWPAPGQAAAREQLGV